MGGSGQERARGEGYERFPGVTLRPLCGQYLPRAPEKTVLHGIIREQLATFLEQAAGGDAPLPQFVRSEFEAYLDCGVLAKGFARVRCASCGYESLVGFSCKSRGLCPSCGARRMTQTAAFLVDEVLPHAPYRQWVLTLPFRLRFLLARRPQLVTSVLGLFLRAVGGVLRRKARALGAPKGQVGAVTFVQRFGDALNLHVHFHAILPDGVFTLDERGAAVFHPVPPPSDEEVLALCLQTRERVLRLLEREGYLDLEEAPDALAALQACAVQGSLGLFQPEQRRPRRRCAAVDGFTVHANVHLHAHDREGLERLCRYGARPSFSLSRLGRLADGRVTYQLKRPLAGGEELLVLHPLKFLARLAAMVPPPRAHLVRYHGVFAAHAKLRRAVTSLLHSPEVFDQPPAPPQKSALKGANPLDWASLLRRVYAVDVLECPKCAGRMRVLAFLTEQKVVTKVLSHLGLPAQAPTLAPARYQPEQLALDVPYLGECAPDYAVLLPPRAQGPPVAMLAAA